MAPNRHGSEKFVIQIWTNRNAEIAGLDIAGLDNGGPDIDGLGIAGLDIDGRCVGS